MKSNLMKAILLETEKEKRDKALSPKTQAEKYATARELITSFPFPSYQKFLGYFILPFIML